jgi:hypothetical protein
MKQLLFVFLLCSFVATAQKKEPVKSDTLTVIAQGDKFPEVIEKDMATNAELIQKLEAELQRVKVQNEKYYNIILQINGIKRDDLIGVPAYEPGKLTFKVKKK